MSNQKVRHAVVGIGATVYNMHKDGLFLEDSEVVGVNDIDHEAGKQRAAEIGTEFFADFDTMIKETQPDSVVVIVPHPLHPEFTIKSLEAGINVLVEKPMAVTVADAEAMIKASEASGKLLAVNFQQRARPEIIAAKNLIDSGELGRVQHADIKITWTRTKKYYDSAGWRGTWDGEGGGVLMNQAPHELDLLTHFLGMPTRVFGWNRTIVHGIETEDTIQAMCEWENGAIASLHISTAEAGQPQRFEMIGTGGYLSIGHGRLNFQKFDTDIVTFINTSQERFAAPNLIPEDVEIKDTPSGHKAIYLNYHEAILNGVPLIADARSSLMGLELANGITYSSYANRPVDFPLDRQAYSDLLADLQAGKEIKL